MQCFMTVREWRNVIGPLLLVAFTVSPASAGQIEDASDAARLVAILLDAGRVTIARNQELINDPGIGDNGFTPAVFERQVIAEFQQRTGIALDNQESAGIPTMAKSLLARLLEESKKTVASYQTVINIPGLKYKGLIPATFGTETAKRFQNWSGVYLKQTAPDHVLRNPMNKPDTYEAAAFQRLAGSPAQRPSDAVLSEFVEKEQSVRVMLPLFYGKACLACHGEPKGERDISGYPREGAKEGDLGGAISVKIPLK
jgi:general secretion pathway protein A